MMVIGEIHYRNIAILLGCVLGLFAVGMALVPVFRLLNRKLSRWNVLERKFPARDLQKTGEAYKACGYSSGLQSTSIRMYLVEFAGEGLLVTPSFARGSPILIPWSAIRGVASTDMGILGSDVSVNVECERPLGFHLPLAAIAAIQKYVPAERINKGAISASSPGATLNGMISLAKNRQK